MKTFNLLMVIIFVIILSSCSNDKTTNPNVNSLNIEFVLIPAGNFQMGNTGLFSGEPEEKPVHSVTITKSLYMSKYEITQAQWYEVMNSIPSSSAIGDSNPVECINWYNAVEFCNKLSDKDGLQRCYSGSDSNIICNWNANGYRLPTEAEWEYAYKAGTTSDYYNGNLTSDVCFILDLNLDKIGWYCGNANLKDMWGTHPVGEKVPNLFGLYDMSGNVLEWCWDWLSYYNDSSQIDPIGPSTGQYRVMRGGSWGFDAKLCRGSIRNSYPPDMSWVFSGFRIVKRY